MSECVCAGALDSMCIRDNANAMRLLAKLGLLEIESEHGRRVIGRFRKGAE